MQLLSPEGLHCYESISRSDVPRGAQILQAKMDLKIKLTTAGEYIKRKARLVCLGNLERPDPTRDLFSPTVNNKTINLMFALAAQHGLKLRGLDIYGAFITADIDEPVYMQLPKGLRPDINGEPPIWAAVAEDTLRSPSLAQGFLAMTSYPNSWKSSDTRDQSTIAACFTSTSATVARSCSASTSTTSPSLPRTTNSLISFAKSLRRSTS